MDFLTLLSYATPFLTLGLGWWFTVMNHKREKDAEKAEEARKVEEDKRKEEIAELKKDIETVNLRLQTFKKASNHLGMEDKINRVVDINETVLSYSIILGELTETLAKCLIAEVPGLYPDTKKDISTILKKFQDADKNLNSKILGSVFIKGGEK